MVFERLKMRKNKLHPHSEMNTIRKFLIPLILTLCCGWTPVYAQLDVRLAPVGREYILGEDASLRLSITNRTDAPVSLVNTPGRCWLFLNVMRQGDVSNVAPNAIPRYPNLTIAPGSHREFTISLSPAYKIRQPGMYRVTATLRLPDMSTVFTSNAALFNVGSGATVQAFQVQVRGQRLVISLRSMMVGGKSMLYGQVMNADTRAVLGACRMGEYLNFMRPRVMLDSAQNLHMLCQSTPKFFTYAVMNTYGQLREKKIMKQVGGLVDLVGSGKGIRCVGVAPYVRPKGERSQYHSATERP